MKLVFLVALLVSMGTAYGQNLHMIEMSTDNSALGGLSFSESGGDGNSKSSDTNIFIGGNYAYKISERVQLGIQGTYLKSDSDFEAYSVLAGAIYNFDDDLTKAFYASLYTGLSWVQYQESIRAKLALGKRFALSNINLPNITYSPEISVSRSEYSKSGSYSNNVTVSFIQFSAFF